MALPKILRYAVIGLFVAIFAISGQVFATLDYPLQQGSTILTQEQDDVIGKEVRDSDDALRDGTEAVAEGIGDASSDEQIFYEEIEDTGEAWTELTRTAQGIVNRILGISGLIVLIYLLYHGFLVLTAGGDENKVKKGWRGVKNALIAILGIALAWFVISIIFWIINVLTNS